MDNNAPVPAERMTFSLAEVQSMMGVSRSTICRAIASGELRTVKIRGRRLVPRLELARITGADLDDGFASARHGAA
jgi:excisionase family DNA binding protein